MQEIVLATSNKGKIAELEALLAPVSCIPQSALGIGSVEETGLSFIENAILKARHASLMANRPALADDSGLVVLALNGAPGIYSSRFAGDNATDEDNIRLLLDKLKTTPMEARQAYFYCAMAYVAHANDPTPVIAQGKWEGFIHETAQGVQGFGYDPIFYLPAYQCTAAQLPASIKNTISHRALALKALGKQLHDEH
ncbi:MAG: RdgB/HAM1 family non-canonical purine NTP pyrophosphatase [Tatlockia sp.]|jgi:XTP/dITP diphosphohydrolase